VAFEAWLKPIRKLVGRFRQAAEAIFDVLWPEYEPSETAFQLARWLLDEALGRIDEWRESAARAGSEMALSFVLSWYDEVDLDRLATRRKSASAVGDPFVNKLHARACAIAKYVAIDQFVSPLEGEEGEKRDGGDGDSEGAATPMTATMPMTRKEPAPALETAKMTTRSTPAPKKTPSNLVMCKKQSLTVRSPGCRVQMYLNNYPFVYRKLMLL